MKKKKKSQKAPKRRPAQKRLDPELLREFQHVTSLYAEPVADGEYLHGDYHGDGHHPHWDEHTDVKGRRTEHGDERRHYDSDAPRPGPPGPLPPGHGDVNAGHLDWWSHTDYNPGDHVDYGYHGDAPECRHWDSHSDWKEGHIDEGGHPDIA